MRFTFEKEITGFEPDVDVEVLFAADRYLTKIAKKLGIAPIHDFYSSYPAGEIDDAAEYIDVDKDNWRVWYEADEGLKIVKPLIKYLEENPDEPEVVPAMVETLKELELALLEAKRYNLKWNIEVD